MHREVAILEVRARTTGEGSLCVARTPGTCIPIWCHLPSAHAKGPQSSLGVLKSSTCLCRPVRMGDQGTIVY